MKRWLGRLAMLACIAAASNVLAVLAAPRLIHALVTHRITTQALAASGGAQSRTGDIAVHAPRADASARTVVRPSPDLLYTACVFDVSRRPLHITGPVPDSYASLSGFAANTDNFFALNDAAVTADASGRRRFDVVLARAPLAQLPPGARLVLSPTARGLVLFRTLIPDEATLPALLALQQQQACEPL
ncbi:MAG TPA: DUF1254 domain-containing protein [Candidatus Binatia bacterium]|nr:DUF1254 domain-containing protein [Candidatus Binatia bacterium]